MKKILIFSLLFTFALGIISTQDLNAIATGDLMICGVGANCEPGGGGSSIPYISVDTTTIYSDSWDEVQMPTCTVYDDETLDCEVSGAIDIYSNGEYSIHFDATDSLGNEAYTKTVTIVISNPRVNDSLLPESYCSSSYTGQLTSIQATECQRLLNAYILLNNANGVIEDSGDLVVTYGGAIPKDSCSSLGGDYYPVTQIDKGSYLYDVSTYRSSNREDFYDGDYFYEFIKGLNIFSHNDDYHKKWKIYESCELHVKNNEKFYFTEQRDVFMTEYVESISEFVCEKRYNDYTEPNCHHKVQQIYVPVELVRQELATLLQAEYYDVDPNFFSNLDLGLGEFITISTLDGILLHLVSKGIFELSGSGAGFSFPPVSTSYALLKTVIATHDYIEAVHEEQIYTMLTKLMNWTSSSESNGKYVVFTRAQRFITTSEDTFYNESFFEFLHNTNGFYRYSVSEYDKDYVSLKLENEGLEDTYLDEIFSGQIENGNLNGKLYFEITRLIDYNINDMLSGFYLLNES